MNRKSVIGTVLAFVASASFASAIAAPAARETSNHWTWCGWGGGGYMWSAVWHPTKPGVIYMGGDCAGCYRTDDDGLHWKMINNGLTSYAVYGMAVDPKTPDTVYAMTDRGGLCKSTDAGERWKLIEGTEEGKLAICSGRNVSVRPLAVDPTNSKLVYAATPFGKIYKSEDGAQTWKAIHQLSSGEEVLPDALRAEFPAGQWFGGFGVNLEAPAVKPGDIRGLGFTFKGNGHAPKKVNLYFREGPASYQSKNLCAIFENPDWQEVVLTPDDFTLNPAAAKKTPEAAKAWPQHPMMKAVDHLDVQGYDMSTLKKPAVGHFRMFYYALADQKKAVVRDYAKDKTVNTYGSINTKGAKPPAFSRISLCQSDPKLLLAASPQKGVFLSRDAGQNWQRIDATGARIAIFDRANPQILYAACGLEGVRKSTDGGNTWNAINNGFKKDFNAVEIAMSPANATNLLCIGNTGSAWDGHAYGSDDAGQTWQAGARLKPNPDANPTSGMGGLSRPTNIAWCPIDPRKIFLSANWRTAYSGDGGRTWEERDRGADISCVYDIRFSKGRVYVGCMDEGLLYSDDNGRHWANPMPAGPNIDRIAGHYWRLNISDNHGVDRVVSTVSPWNNAYPNRVVVSEDGAKTFKVVNEGLLAQKPTLNCVWGTGYPRALCSDPKDPKTLYMGIDGDNAGIFKSTDGGDTWMQLEHQPGSRRMFFGLQVDPTDSQRIFWSAANGKGSGIYRSEDGGNSWKCVKPLPSCFDIAISPSGIVYGGDADLWCSTDHGDTWKKLGTGPAGGCIESIEIDPRNEKTLWYSTVKWGGQVWGYIMKTTDGGKTWTDITGDIGFRKPAVLRFDPVTQELWAGGVGLFRIKQ